MWIYTQKRWRHVCVSSDVHVSLLEISGFLYIIDTLLVYISLIYILNIYLLTYMYREWFNVELLKFEISYVTDD